MMAVEIERKFLLPEYPKELIRDGMLDKVSVQRIEQTYLALADEDELRLRRLTDVETGNAKYKLTYKRGHGIVRQEVEQDITESLYDELMQQFPLRPLLKERTTLRLESSGMQLEIDRYTHLSLMVVEVEFPSEEEANLFEPPAWFGPEISSDKKYSNKELWKQLNR